MSRYESMTHDRAVELLPWLVNDSLESNEKSQLLAHAQACVVCRRELEELEALHEEIGRVEQNAHAAPVDMRNINQRIDNHMSRRRWLPELVDTVAARLPSPLKMAVVVQAVVIVSMLGFLLAPESRQPAYTTLTSESGLPPGNYLRVVVSPSIDEAALAALLARHGLSIVEGPSERGVATVAFATDAGAEHRRAVADALSGDTALRFVQPVTIGRSP